MRSVLSIIFRLILAPYICIYTTCCQSVFEKKQTKLSLAQENDSLYFLEIRTDTSVNRWQLPYPVYQFQIGDIDDDGVDDMIVGVIKTTRFDSTLSKRIFIFKNYKGLVRPLWLGSRLGQPLEDFAFIMEQDKPFIRSIERERSGKYLVADYKWKRFGLVFSKYLCKEVEIIEANKFMTK